MKYLPAFVALAVLLLTVGTIYLGSRVHEDAVVAHPFEAGQDYSRTAAEAGVGDEHVHALSAKAAAPSRCDLGAGACRAELEGGTELVIELAPRPLSTMKELTVEAQLHRLGEPVSGAQVAISFTMDGMRMGDNTVRLAGLGSGRYQGKAVLVRCPSGRRDWLARVTVREGESEGGTELLLRVGE
jgi:nitrogen fixation protein FixH